MSSEFYIQGHRDGEKDGVGHSVILDAFYDGASRTPNRGFYPLAYDETNVCDFTLTEPGGKVTAICIHRPCGHASLFQSIFTILRSGPYVLFAPGGTAPVIARPEMSVHVPRDMVEALGEPVLVADAQTIVGALFG